MANQDFFGHEVEMEEADANGNPKQEQRGQNEKQCKRDKHWRKFEKAQGKAFRGFIGGLSTAGIAVLIGLAVAGIAHLSFWGWVGVFLLYSFVRKAGRPHWKKHRHHFGYACQCEAHRA